MEDIVASLCKTTNDSNLSSTMSNETTTTTLEQILSDLKGSPDSYLKQFANSNLSLNSLNKCKQNLDLKKLNVSLVVGEDVDKNVV